MTDQPDDLLLTEDMIKHLHAAALAIAKCGEGFGKIVIVIEKGKPKRIEKTFDEWLIRRN